MHIFNGPRKVLIIDLWVLYTLGGFSNYLIKRGTLKTVR